MKRKSVDKRGLAIAYIAKELSIPPASFFQHLSERMDKSEETIRRYAIGESTMKMNFNSFFILVEQTVADYLNSDMIAEDHLTAVNEKWKQERKRLKAACRLFFFFSLDMQTRPEDVSKPIRNIMNWNTVMAEAFKRVFLQLDKQTAYKLQRDFSAYRSIDLRDLKFVSAMIEKSKVKKQELQAFMYRQETVSAETMQEHLISKTVRHWVNVRNETYKDACKLRNNTDESWEKFYNKFVESNTGYPTLLITFLMTILFSVNEEGELILDKRRFGKTEIDMLLLFKYCLTEAGQRAVLNY